MIYLYRKNGGQILGVSVDASSYAGTDPTYFGSLTNPTLTDGPDLNTPKMWDGSTVRNATAQEQSTFITAKATDDNLVARDQAWSRIQGSDPVFRKALQAIVSVLVDEINVIRTNPALGLSARTMAQAKTAIQNKINGGTVD